MAAKKKSTKATSKARKTARPATKRAAAKPAHKPRRQPETLRLNTMSPSLTVNDVERSLRFYRDILGFTVKQRMEENGKLRGVELLAGKITLWLSQDDWGKGRDRVKGLGFRLYCGTSQKIDALAQQVKDRGWTLAEEPKNQPWGARDFAVVDPDGFKISFSN
jgi:lactoylglutathione lyase